jgi:hypothetical protein
VKHLQPLGLQQRIIEVGLQVLDGEYLGTLDDALAVSILGGRIAPLLEEEFQQLFELLV